MNQSLFDALARSRIVRIFEESFPVATGFVLKLQPVDGTKELNPFVSNANPFCRLMTRSPQGKAVCNRTFAAIRDKAAGTFEPSLSYCFAGFAHIAIPVISAGEHIATIYGGQLLLKTPTKQGFRKISPQLASLGLGGRLTELEQAWLNTPVVSEEQLKAMMYLLETFARRISRYASSKVLEAADGEPAAVTRAREFIQDHCAGPITLPETAGHVHMSAFTFGNLFKRVTGLTFARYLTRVRVENAKSMLAHPAVSIRDIAFQSGFETISQFNRSFRHVRGHVAHRISRLAGGDCVAFCHGIGPTPRHRVSVPAPERFRSPRFSPPDAMVLVPSSQSRRRWSFIRRCGDGFG